MNKKTLTTLIAVVVVIAIVAVIGIMGGNPDATMACADCEGAGAIEEAACETCGATGKVAADTPYYATWMALLAPVIAIALALVTKEVYSSLVIGIVVGGLLVSNFDIVKTFDNVMQAGFIEAVSGTAGIFIFLVILGIMVCMVNRAGGSAAFGRWAQKNIKSRVGATLCTFVLGVLIFIDDYFNCLTVGSVMRPVTDSQRISRAKLAYLIDATAAPICMIAPISSWAAAVSSYAAEGEGIKLFVQAIPYNLYSLLTLGFIISITLMKVDFGPMKIHEYNALIKGDLTTSGTVEIEKEEEVNSHGRVIDLVLPIIVLIVACVLSLIYNGGFFEADGEYFHDFVGAFGNTDATVGLPLGAFVALIFTVAYMALRKVVSVGDAMKSVPKGFNAMVPAILILTFATALKNMTNLLGADVFVENLMNGAAEGLSNFLPAIIFLVAVFLHLSRRIPAQLLLP